MKTYNIIDPTKPKSIWDPRSEFMRELEITKHRLETRPRKVNMMDTQDAMLRELVEVKEKIMVVNNYGGQK